jgi:hypothetical protein
MARNVRLEMRQNNPEKRPRLIMHQRSWYFPELINEDFVLDVLKITEIRHSHDVR